MLPYSDLYILKCKKYKHVVHKYCVRLNDNVTLFRPNFEIVFYKNLVETIKLTFYLL